MSTQPVMGKKGSYAQSMREMPAYIDRLRDERQRLKVTNEALRAENAALFNALQVIRLTPTIRAFLEQWDAMALQQVDAAFAGVTASTAGTEEHKSMLAWIEAGGSIGKGE